MNKKKTIYAILVLIVVLAITTLLIKSKYGWYTLAEVNSKTYSLDMPINCPSEAVQFWKNLGIFNISELSGQLPEWQTNTNEWRVHATKSDDTWYVTVITRRNIPSYSCAYSFNTKGQPINENYISKLCGWNK